MTEEQRFIARLVQLSKLTGATMDESLVALYDQHLARFGYGQVAQVIEDMIVNRKSSDRMPSIREIADRLEPSHNIDSATQSLLARAIEGAAKIGRPYPEDTEHIARVREFVGEVLWAAMPGLSGWQEWCAAGDRFLGGMELGTARAQLRDRIASCLRVAFPGGRVPLDVHRLPASAMEALPGAQGMPSRIDSGTEKRIFELVAGNAAVTRGIK